MSIASVSAKPAPQPPAPLSAAQKEEKRKALLEKLHARTSEIAKMVAAATAITDASPITEPAGKAFLTKNWDDGDMAPVLKGIDPTDPQ